MPRPIKEGVDYFPLDTDIFNDRTVRRLIARFGPQGWCVYCSLLCEIYRNRGYYIICNDDLMFDLADKIGVDEAFAAEVVGWALRSGLFNFGLHERFSILTSGEIQRRYVMAREKACVVFVDEYMLVDEAEIDRRRLRKLPLGKEVACGE